MPITTLVLGLEVLFVVAFVVMVLANMIVLPPVMVAVVGEVFT